MSISADDVKHIAALARVGVSDERVPVLVQELNGILGHMDALQRVELPSDIHAESLVMPLRADVHAASLDASARASFAPATRDGFFLVPRLATHADAGAAADESDE